MTKGVVGTLYTIEWRGYNCPEGWPVDIALLFAMLRHP